MDKLSSMLPEYKAVMDIYGVGKVLCVQLIAKIGDVRRLNISKSLVAMAGIDPPRLTNQGKLTQNREAFPNVVLLLFARHFFKS